MRERDTERILRRRWVHSHEEDSDEEMVFRPAAYELPPSRGRRSFELKPDGILAKGGIGRTDPALWRRRVRGSSGTTASFSTQDPSETPRVMRTASVDDVRLVVEK
jgi:hypothetical protein